MEKTLARRPWLSPLALAILTIIFLRQVILPVEAGVVLNGKDLQEMFYPLQTFISEALKAGTLPLWNPRQFLGHPVIGNPHAALFYPLNWLVWLIGVQRGIGLVLVLHTWFGAWGMERFTRSFGASRVGALLAGVIFSMSGWAAAHYFPGHYNLLMVFAWIPWVMLAYRYALRRGTWVALLPGMAGLGLALLAGYPPLVVYMGFGLISLWLYHIGTAPEGQEVRAGWEAGWRLAAIGVGGLILAAALVIPAAQLTRLASREAGDLEFANTFALPPAQYLSLALPGLFGRPDWAPYFYWGADFYEEHNAYAGLLPLLAVPLMIRWPRREAWYFYGLIAFGLVMAVGIEGALMPLLVRWVPGLGMFRVPARGMMYVMFGMAGLTALLVTNLQAASLDERRRALRPALRRWIPAAAAGSFGLSVFFSGWYASASHVEPMPLRAFEVAGTLAMAGVILCGVWVVLWLWTRPEPKAPGWALGLAALLIVLDAWHVGIPVIGVSQVIEPGMWTGARTNIPLGADARVLQVSPAGGTTNLASVTGHLHVLGYDPLHLATFDTLADNDAENDPQTRVNELFGVKYLLSNEQLDAPGYELIGIAYDTFYYERTEAFPRAWIGTDIVVEPNDEAVAARIDDQTTDLQQTAFVDEAVTCPAGEDGSATISEYNLNDVTITTSGGGGLLVLSDQYYPGWHATVDGDEADIVRTDVALRGVCVPAGEHTVRFEFRPLSLVAGVGVSAVGWLVWLAAMVIGWRRKRL
ncbi:YfhO family protein [Aggregatilinea lenta]|uniref:YfhO family protein n=1 Tax=Aggregatilinea lenta TaxID=913108 RepID=UPI000E5C0E9D|nr:YfhO family protein [Aggregatilinea lenta]